MICKFCGNVIEDSSDFCFICGQKVAEEAPAATPAEEKVTASKKAGIKHLAGQPKLVSASKVSAEDLSSLWESLTVRSF